MESCFDLSFQRTKIGNYWIREGTLVVPLIYAVHRDQRYWDKPDEFIPERHLEDNGSIRKSDYFIPFQTGKTICFFAIVLNFLNQAHCVSVDNNF